MFQNKSFAAKQIRAQLRWAKLRYGNSRVDKLYKRQISVLAVSYLASRSSSLDTRSCSLSRHRIDHYIDLQTFVLSTLKTVCFYKIESHHNPRSYCVITPQFGHMISMALEILCYLKSSPNI